MFTCLDGPEVPWISGPATIKVGENVTLICHAPSNPPCSYMWIFNGSVVATTSTYVTPPFTTEMNRVYTCVAHNNVTDKNSTAYKMIFAICEGFFLLLFCVVVVLGEGVFKCFSFKYSSLEYVVFSDPITDMQIASPMKAAIQGQLYNLTCNVTGSAKAVQWFKNEQTLQADNKTIFFDNHKTITFNPLQNNHSGLYYCYARNMVSTMSSHPHLLLVNCE